MEEGSIGWDLGALDKSERIIAVKCEIEILILTTNALRKSNGDAKYC